MLINLRIEEKWQKRPKLGLVWKEPNYPRRALLAVLPVIYFVSFPFCEPELEEKMNGCPYCDPMKE